jgi:hypothetical protein
MPSGGARIMSKDKDVDILPSSPERLKAFVQFFKSYMSLSSLLTAALPIPVAAFELIPTYQAQTKILSVYTPLFCFLILGFIFYSRHILARLMFPEFFGKAYAKVHMIKFGPIMTTVIRSLIRILPLSLIILSITFAFAYHFTLDRSINDRRAMLKEEVGLSDLTNTRVKAENDLTQKVNTQKQSGNPITEGDARVHDNELKKIESLRVREEELQKIYSSRIKSEEVLKTDRGLIPYSNTLMVLYIATFLTAEACFILMAIKEYLQDLIGLTEKDLITRNKTTL